MHAYMLAVFLVFATIEGAAFAYINGGSNLGAVTAGRLCTELAGAGVAAGAQREGHMLRSVTCSGAGRVFNVRLVID